MEARQPEQTGYRGPGDGPWMPRAAQGRTTGAAQLPCSPDEESEHRKTAGHRHAARLPGCAPSSLVHRTCPAAHYCSPAPRRPAGAGAPCRRHGETWCTTAAGGRRRETRCSLVTLGPRHGRHGGSDAAHTGGIRLWETTSCAGTAPAPSSPYGRAVQSTGPRTTTSDPVAGDGRWETKCCSATHCE